MIPSPTTRQRLLDAGLGLFSRNGYRGASVRDLCDAARANPGAVSYHFGSKRQLYRAVLRRAAKDLAAAVRQRLSGETSQDPAHLTATAAVVIGERSAAVRLLLWDLADGGDGAVESFAPLLRTAMDRILEERGADHDPSVRLAAIESVLLAMAPPFLLLAAWPVLQRALGLPPDSLEHWLKRLAVTSR